MQKTLERYGFGIVVGTMVSIALLFLMQSLVQPNQMELDDSPPFIPIDIVRMIDDIEARPKKRNPDPPPKIEELPPPIPIGSDDDVGSVVWSPHRAPKVESPSGPDIGEYGSDGDSLPLVKVEPNYPTRALQRGIEGYVVLSFTVTETGSVEDPVVEVSEPPGVFDRSATKAVQKFKYRPKVVDGVPMRVEGRKHRFVFELED